MRTRSSAKGPKRLEETLPEQPKSPTEIHAIPSSESPTSTELNDTFEEFVQDWILDDLIFEVAIEMNWLFKSGQISLDELYQLRPLISFLPNEKPKKEESKKLSSAIINLINVPCNVCGEEVSGLRFASHLERCINGGKRGGRKFYESLKDPVEPKPKIRKEIVDPHPTSLIVRVKLRNGVPYGNKQRIGATLEEFNNEGHSSVHS